MFNENFNNFSNLRYSIIIVLLCGLPFLFSKYVELPYWADDISLGVVGLLPFFFFVVWLSKHVEKFFIWLGRIGDANPFLAYVIFFIIMIIVISFVD